MQFVILREHHGQRVYEDRMLRRVFGSKREEVEVAEEWRKLHI